jgi:carboxyl-terminal processing protease
MRYAHQVGLAAGVLVSFGLASWFTLKFGQGGLWRGLEPALAVTAKQVAKGPYDLTRLEAVNETLKLVRDKYVDPARVRPRDMLLSALNRIQQDVAQVIVLHDENGPEVLVRVEATERKFRVDNIQGPWDIAARLREIFAFLQENLRGTEVDLRDVEYAACNGMLRTLDPHSVFLSPEAYKEMNTSTSGAFGGLGIVISIRDQMLTVMNPMPNTPAGRAGIKRMDRITKINNESTLNMPLDDAVRRLRGEPGTKVTVWIHRDGPDGWSGSKAFELTREQIRVKSVDARLLDGGVGYIRLKQFQSASSKEVEAALADFRTKEPRFKGLILDLRGNPGGLLDQAVKIADLFVKSGTLVATVGASEGREEKQARPSAEPPYPIVLLVNGQSASASEIVAGALKNLDRAVVVGTTTFGKGSVQLVFSDITAEKAALKLTIAQYLTPGDESIQSVGISPDIELDPMTVDSLEMDLFSDNKKVIRERDLSAHLSNARAREGQRPTYVVRYNLPEQERAAIRDRGGDLDDNFEVDFPIRFGRELVARMPWEQRRTDQLRSVHELVSQTQKDEIIKVGAELAKIGIDWTEAPPDAPGPSAKDFEVTVTTDRPENEVTAGQPMNLKVTVKNNGKDPVYRLRAITTSDSGYYDGKELIFGKIAPGQSKVATVPLGWCEIEGKKPGSTAPTPANAPRVCRIPKDATTRQDGVKIRFEADGDHIPAETEIRPTVRALPRPQFAYAYEMIDNRNGANGDGRFQRGEGATLYLTVKNVGQGRSYETQANLRNLSGDGILLNEGRFTISDMAPGEQRRVALTFDVQQALEDGEFKVELTVGDRELREFAVEKIKALIEPPARIEAVGGAVIPSGDSAFLYESPSAAARAFGRLPAKASLRVLGRVGEFYKVDLAQGRFAFVARKEVSEGGSPPAEPVFEHLLLRSPPQIELQSPPLATRDSKIKLSGVASDGDRILDSYIFVNARKVFYRSNRNGQDPKKLPIEADVSLRPGINVIRLFARENPDTVTQRVLVIRRDGPGGELLPTPKTEEHLFEETGELPQRPSRTRYITGPGLWPQVRSQGRGLPRSITSPTPMVPSLLCPRSPAISLLVPTSLRSTPPLSLPRPVTRSSMESSSKWLPPLNLTPARTPNSLRCSKLMSPLISTPPWTCSLAPTR